MLAPLVLAYIFASATPVQYDVDVTFTGFLPVLGGKDGSAKAVMSVEVTGLSPDPEGNPRATSEIKALTMSLNGGTLPLGPKSIAMFFPKTTISFTPEGKIVKTSAPNVKLPVRLPGLDAKRFPDITYLPLEFPKEGIELGKVFTFKKAFGDSDVNYEVTPTKIEGNTVTFDLKVAQSYVSFEDASANPTTQDQAVAKVTTQVTGSGKAQFNVVPTALIELQMTADASSVVENLSDHSTKNRRLKTVLKVKRKAIS